MIHRFKEITPDQSVKDCSLDELLSSCQTAFSIVGYTPKNLENSFDKVFENTDTNTSLFIFIFDVFREDNK